MRPINLHLPFVEGIRKTIIHDGVFYIPANSDNSTYPFPGWDHPDLFGNSHPIHIEYCSGNGAWIAEKAKAHPNTNWIAIERKFVRSRKIWAKRKNYGLKNLIIVSAEGHQATKSFIPSESIAHVFINFPDPWPKTRHAKHRIIQMSFLQEIRRILKPHGFFTFVTDDAAYSSWTIDMIGKISGFKSLCPPPFYTTEQEEYGTSYFEDLWREKGKTIRYHLYQKEEIPNG